MLQFTFSRIIIASLIVLLQYSCNTYEDIGAEKIKSIKRLNRIGKKVRLTSKSHIVFSYEELVKKLSEADSGAVVFIAENVQINCTNRAVIQLKTGVTLASSGDEKAGILFTKDLGHRPLLEIKGNNAKLFGLKVFGPDTLRRVEQMYDLLEHDKYYSLPYSYGVYCHYYNNLTVENCEFAGWSYAAISLQDSYNNEFRYNFIHHNQRLGTGYGVLLNRADALIEYNYFDDNRHSITGSGRLNTSYIIRYNVFGKNSLNYVIDMHNITDEMLNKDIAGSKIEIYNNTFYTEEDGSIVIHGDPIQKAIIKNNIFYKKESKAMLLKCKKQKIEKSGNLFLKTANKKKNEASPNRKLIKSKVILDKINTHSFENVYSDLKDDKD